MNPKAVKTCRNHCRACLWSKHVDESVPGDRNSVCNGMMYPMAVTTSGKKGLQIVHECAKCKARKLNKVAQDDNMELITKLSQIPYDVQP
ncbi:RNHCP domain-containing protein [Patescibacteria group bacterium]|nr:RNHCP domain-containing protein [Patescibacteria group bacterium]MBU1703029.1 RNHCP domain-containing protein [Patescibacteria group bacterium]MBU1953923.1 RNHCP domain-containing protein [Patescibacteria group bacterium]